MAAPLETPSLFLYVCLLLYHTKSNNLSLISKTQKLRKRLKQSIPRFMLSKIRFMLQKNELFLYLNPECCAYTHFAALHKDSAFVIFFHNALGK